MRGLQIYRDEKKKGIDMQSSLFLFLLSHWYFTIKKFSSILDLQEYGAVADLLNLLKWSHQTSFTGVDELNNVMNIKNLVSMKQMDPIQLHQLQLLSLLESPLQKSMTVFNALIMDFIRH